MTEYREPLNELSEEVGEWSESNFGAQAHSNPLMGAAEEVGELAQTFVEGYPNGYDVNRRNATLMLIGNQGRLVRSVLKQNQGIREDEDRVGPEAEYNFVEDIRYSCRAIEGNDDMQEPEVETDIEEEMDAVGDIIVYLADYCHRRGINLGDALAMAWEDEVSDREWEADKK